MVHHKTAYSGVMHILKKLLMKQYIFMKTAWARCAGLLVLNFISLVVNCDNRKIRTKQVVKDNMTS